MGAEEASTRGVSHVPPEQVMTRLMHRKDTESRHYGLDYLILLMFAGGLVFGVLLAFWR